MSSGQEQFRKTRQDSEAEPVDPPVVAAGQAQVNTQQVDSILDEIDGMLENNAEEFVRNFVQKGGQ